MGIGNNGAVPNLSLVNNLWNFNSDFDCFFDHYLYNLPSDYNDSLITPFWINLSQQLNDHVFKDSQEICNPFWKLGLLGFRIHLIFILIIEPETLSLSEILANLGTIGRTKLGLERFDSLAKRGNMKIPLWKLLLNFVQLLIGFFKLGLHFIFVSNQINLLLFSKHYFVFNRLLSYIFINVDFFFKWSGHLFSFGLEKGL